MEPIHRDQLRPRPRARSRRPPRRFSALRFASARKRLPPRFFVTLAPLFSTRPRPRLRNLPSGARRWHGPDALLRDMPESRLRNPSSPGNRIEPVSPQDRFTFPLSRSPCGPSLRMDHPGVLSSEALRLPRQAPIFASTNCFAAWFMRPGDYRNVTLFVAYLTNLAYSL